MLNYSVSRGIFDATEVTNFFAYLRDECVYSFSENILRFWRENNSNNWKIINIISWEYNVFQASFNIINFNFNEQLGNSSLSIFTETFLNSSTITSSSSTRKTTKLKIKNYPGDITQISTSARYPLTCWKKRNIKPIKSTLHTLNHFLEREKSSTFNKKRKNPFLIHDLYKRYRIFLKQNITSLQNLNP